LPAPQGFLLAIDLGTTACKAALYAFDGRRAGICRASIPLYSPEPSAAEQEPDEWRAALELSLHQLSQHYPEPMRAVVGIGLAAQMNAILLLDSQNKPMGRAQSAMDQRAVPYSARLRAEYASDFPDIYFGHSTSLGRIAWLRNQRPQLFENCAHISDACGLLNYWLTGTFASNASIGVWRWTPELAAILGVSLDMLPEILLPWEITGRLLPEFARRTGLPAGIPVVAGSGDGPCANIGAGALRLSEGCVTLGTSGVVRAVLPGPLPVHASIPVFSYPFVNGLWLGGGYYPAGACLHWLRNLLEDGGWPNAEFEWLQRYLPEVSALPPGAEGLMFIPRLFGQENGGTSIAGLRFSHRAEHLLRAIFEGTACALKAAVNHLGNSGFRSERWRATGGGMEIPQWRQILADVFAMPLELTNGDSSLGAAVLAAVGLGIYPDLETAVEKMVRVAGEILPLPEESQLYQQVFESYRPYL
jgi:xylulokinase